MYRYPIEYDVLVIGAGHAGIEAALAASRLGCRVALLTQNADTIGQMSCNPAIGGLAKGHMVREIDALGGVMGQNTDATAIQWRLLNSSKGPAVQAPRAQCDKKAYQFRLKHHLESDPRIEIHQGNITDILTTDQKISAVTTSIGITYSTKTVVLSAGTFMQALMHVGLKQQVGGRMGDHKSTISDALRQFGFEIGRFKTGTPCRINGNSIDFSKCEIQRGDDQPTFFTFSPHKLVREPDDLFTLNPIADPLFHVEQKPCFITYTQPETHEIIRNNLHQSPMYCGVIEGIGPRYCPSIEDKIVRFADKERHQIYLEPEGKHTHEYYINGVSTSLPYEVQYDFLHTIPGLEKCQIMRPGYAVEYDYCLPTQLNHSLETKKIEGLFFAGQINGTSGYEEAAAQGLIAGTNAARKVLNLPPLLLKRSDAYIGVMIDDLVTKGCTEPYRMFTSRAEYRLKLRHDNADFRLSKLAFDHGLISSSDFEAVNQKKLALETAISSLAKIAYEGVKLDHWFRRSENHWSKLPDSIIRDYDASLWNQIETIFKYEGHIARQDLQIAKHQRFDEKIIPDHLNFHEIKGLKKEALHRFITMSPKTIGQASRLSGITPADVALLIIHLEKDKK